MILVSNTLRAHQKKSLAAWEILNRVKDRRLMPVYREVLSETTASRYDIHTFDIARVPCATQILSPLCMFDGLFAWSRVTFWVFVIGWSRFGRVVSAFVLVGYIDGATTFGRYIFFVIVWDAMLLFWNTIVTHAWPAGGRVISFCWWSATVWGAWLDTRVSGVCRVMDDGFLVRRISSREVGMCWHACEQVPKKKFDSMYINFRPFVPAEIGGEA